MPAQVDAQELKTGLTIFRRADVKHRNWYCRIKLPDEDRYKTLSLKTPDINVARDKAFEQDADVRFRIKHEIPVFNKAFSQVAQEFSAFQKERSEAGQITHHRWRVMDSHIRTQLNRYVGTVQITQLARRPVEELPDLAAEERQGPLGRAGERRHHPRRDEHLPLDHGLCRGQELRPRQPGLPWPLPLGKARREEFTPQEYRKLHSFARRWIKQARNALGTWYRTMAYNFVLIMTNTGMRPSEARNLRWRDVATQTDKQGRPSSA